MRLNRMSELRGKPYNAILRVVFCFLYKMPRIEYRPPSYRQHIKMINGSGPYSEGIKIPDDVIKRPFIPSLIRTINAIKGIDVPPQMHLILRTEPFYEEERRYIRCRFYVLNEYDMWLWRQKDAEYNF